MSRWIQLFAAKPVVAVRSTGNQAMAVGKPTERPSLEPFGAPCGPGPIACGDRAPRRVSSPSGNGPSRFRPPGGSSAPTVAAPPAPYVRCCSGFEPS